MVPEKQWRGEGQNMDKRTARKVHAEQFQRTIHEIREEYVRAYEESRRQHKQDDDSDDGHPILGSDQIHVYVRKRPVLPHERAKHEFDVISSVGHREIVIHECRMYNDMRHKYITSHHQRFSRCFDETVETETVYNESMKHLVAHAMRGGKAVCMMYGQTGSGKTYTMGGMLQFIADDLFHEPVGDVDFRVAVSAIEIIGSKVVDLLSNRSKVLVCDDGQGNPYLVNCSELSSDSTHALLDLLDDVKAQRSTEATNVNSQSSRSHLVIYINLRDPDGELHGQIALLDLAGSERNEDTFFHDAARRKESIEINKSHLALKECIRAIGSEDTTGFVPYRASTLTRILKGCLWTKQARASVIATVSPISIDTEHTLHALLCAGQMMEENPTIRTDKTDVKEDDERELEESGEGNIKAPVPIREWDNGMVREWICALRKGEFKKYSKAINSSLDGRMLTRFTVARFSQMCNGNATDAAHLFKALRHEMASQEKLLKARREHNAARVASKEGKNNRF